MKKFPLLTAFAMAAAMGYAGVASAQVADSARKDSSTTRNRNPMPAQTQSPASMGQTARAPGAISDSAIIAMLQLSHTQEIAAADLALSRSSNDRVKAFAEKLKTDHGDALQELQAYADRMKGGQAGGVGAGVGMRDSARVGRDNNVTGRRDSTTPMVSGNDSMSTRRVDSVSSRRDSAMANPNSPMVQADKPKPDSAMAGRRDSSVSNMPQDASKRPGGEPDVTFDNLQGLTGHEFDHGFISLQVSHHETEINHLRNDIIPMIKDSGLKALVQRELPTLGNHLREARELANYLKTVQ